jgi:hypothetical protein
VDNTQVHFDQLIGTQVVGALIPPTQHRLSDRVLDQEQIPERGLGCLDLDRFTAAIDRANAALNDWPLLFADIQQREANFLRKHGGRTA